MSRNIRRGTPRREQRTVPSALSVVLITIFLIGFLAAILFFFTRDRTTAPVQFVGAVGTVEDGGDVRIYAWTDPDSKRTYLVTDRGGICERNLTHVEDEELPEVRTGDEDNSLL